MVRLPEPALVGLGLAVLRPVGLDLVVRLPVARPLVARPLAARRPRQRWSAGLNSGSP